MKMNYLKGVWKCILLTVLLLNISTVISAYELTYNQDKNNVSIEYDNLNRISQKSTGSQEFNYSYDGEYYGTLSNITSDNLTIKYEYDKRERIVKEIRIIDGIQFEKGNSYDSMNRLVEKRLPSTELEYYYTKHGQVRKIGVPLFLVPVVMRVYRTYSPCLEEGGA